jgi:hypothetical protein
VGTERKRRILACIGILAAATGMAGCGGGDGVENASETEQLVARLPEDALSLSFTDLDAVRADLSLPADFAPTGGPEEGTGGSAAAEAFVRATSGTLGGLPGGGSEALSSLRIDQAHLIAGVAGGHSATAITTSANPSEIEANLERDGLERDGDALVSEEGGFAVAIGDRIIGIAKNTDDAEAVLESPSHDPAFPVDEIDGDERTFGRFGSECVEYVATGDTPGEPGEIAYFPVGTPDAGSVVPAGDAGGRVGEPTVECDSVRVGIAAAGDPAMEPVASRALETFTVDYSCDGD